MSSRGPSTWRRAAPIAALLLLSPVIAEVLFGATRITTLFVLLPQIGTWGCAALIIRDLVRRRRRGWPAVLLLGVALAIAEECVIQQTSLAPLVGVDPNHFYGRVLGVNWVYFLWALGYESVWAVVLPIQLTELIFPARHDEPWLGWRGLVLSATVFALASVVAWYSWTQLFVPQYFPESAYRVPLAPMILACATIVALSAVALGLPRWSRGEPGTARPAPQPWLVGVIAFVMGVPWFLLVFLAYGAAPTLPVAIPIAAGIALACTALALIGHWASRSSWHDAHRLALVFGALAASMLAGFAVLQVGGAPLIDTLGKLTLNVIAIVLLIRFAWKPQFRRPAA
jgi:hypothetical protein